MSKVTYESQDGDVGVVTPQSVLNHYARLPLVPLARH